MKNLTKVLLALGGSALALIMTPGPIQDLYSAFVAGHPKVAGIIAVVASVTAALHNPKKEVAAPKP